MKYAIHSKRNGYYIGKCYQCKGALDDVKDYPIFTDDIDKAKHYSSPKRAMIFINKFRDRNPLDYEWEIREVN